MDIPALLRSGTGRHRRPPRRAAAAAWRSRLPTTPLAAVALMFCTLLLTATPETQAGRAQAQSARITPVPRPAVPASPIRPAARETGLPPTTMTVRLRPGDTLWGLAQRHRTTVPVLERLNHLGTSTLIYADGRLQISTATDVRLPCGPHCRTLRRSHHQGSHQPRHSTPLDARLRRRLQRLDLLANPPRLLTKGLSRVSCASCGTPVGRRRP